MSHQEGYSKQLALFTVSTMNRAIEKEELVWHKPRGQVTRESALEFEIPKSANYLDLKSTRLYLQVCIKKKDGTNIKQTDKVGLCNLPLSTLFRQVDVFFNQTSVGEVGINYPYKGYLDVLLNTSKTCDSSLQSQLFFKDTANNFDAVDSSNFGFYARQRYTTGSKFVELYGPLHLGVMNMDRYLINGVSVNIKLWPTQDVFSLMSDKDNYKIEIQQCFLRVRSLKMTPSLMIAHTNVLKKTVAMYPYTRSDIRNFSMVRGIYSKQFEDIFQNKIPDKLVVGIVKGKAFSGQINTNPLEFIHANVNFVNLTINSTMVTGAPLTPNFANGQFVECYNMLFQGRKLDTVDTNRADFAKGYTLYVFDLTNQPKTGNMNLEIKFKNPLSEVTTILLYGQFPALLQIDAARNVYVTD